MRHKTSITTPVMSTQVPIEPPKREPVALKVLAAIAFLLLGISLCVRPLLNEIHTVFVASLLQPPAIRWTATLAAKHLVHMLAAAGIGAAALWTVLGRRRWLVCGLEAGAALLVCAAALSVPVASDKRTAINGVLDTILPLVAAASIYQLLTHRPMWRRVLLAGLVSVSAANCLKATTQYLWEYDRIRQEFEQNRIASLAQLGLRPDEPEAASVAAGHRPIEAKGYFDHANAFATFLVLGFAGTVAALTGFEWRRRRQGSVGGRAMSATRRFSRRSAVPQGAPRDRPSGGSADLPRGLTIAAGAVLVAVACWHLVILGLGQSLGAKVGMVAALMAAAFVWFLREHPRRVAVGLGTSLLLLQGILLAMTLDARDARPFLRAHVTTGMAERLNYWQGCIQFFLASPLTGAGPRQFACLFPSIKPIYCSSIPSDPHSWLLGMAAEWGTLGVLGVLAAVGGIGWKIVKSLAQSQMPDDRSPLGALLPACLLVLSCWLVLLWDQLPGGARELVIPLLVGLLVAAFACLSPLRGRIGQLVLLAAAIAFVVHEMISVGASTPAVASAFWTVAVLALAWKGRELPARQLASVGAGRFARATVILPAATAIAAVALSVRPIRVDMLTNQARQALAGGDAERAVKMFSAAAQVDPWDPLPLRAAALLRYRLAQQDARHSMEHLRQAIDLSQRAALRNPADFMIRRSIAMCTMQLAVRVEDFALVRAAIGQMEAALARYPNWPSGWLELARMAAVQSDTQPDRPDLLQTALAGLDKAETLAKGQVYGDVSKFSDQQFAQIAELRQDLHRRLASLAGASTQPAR
jgi:O-antigen ligase